MLYLIVVAGCATVAWGFLVGRFVRTFRMLLRSKLPEEPLAHWPTVAMIVPARNEEAQIPKTLPTFLAQDYPNLTITIVDDCSEDRTNALLREQETGDGRYTVITGQPHPADWVGKTWALHQGVGATRSEWLLFVDADIRLSPDATRLAVMAAERLGVDLFSIGPNVDCRTFWQRSICLSLATAIFILFPPHLVNDPRYRKVAIAAGGFILIRRNVYEALGGEYELRHEIAEDLRRAQLAKAAGYKLFFTPHPTAAITDFYGTLGDIWTGLRKNFYAGANYNPLILVAVAFLGMNVLWGPSVATVLGGWRLCSESSIDPAILIAFGLGLASWVFQALVVSGAVMFLRVPWWYALMLPIGGTMYQLIGFASAFDYHFGGGPKWKNRSFHPAVVRGDHK